jgi:hypothetical protein
MVNQMRSSFNGHSRVRLCLGAILMFAAGISFMPAWGANNAEATGTVTILTQYSTSLNVPGETVLFSLSSQPSVACPYTSYFIISPSTVTDQQTRKNFLAMLLSAKTTGAQIEVGYDNSGAFCDQGGIGVYLIQML